MRNYNLLIKKTERDHIITNYNQGFYKSEGLTVNLEINQAEQLIVTDITYFKLD